MNCPCGGETKPSTHIVKTLQAALIWFPGVTDDKLPIRIEQDTCTCGRMRARGYDRDGVLIGSRG